MTELTLKYGKKEMTISAEIFSRQDRIVLSTLLYGVKQEISMDYAEAHKFIDGLCQAHNTAFNEKHQNLEELKRAFKVTDEEISTWAKKECM